MHRVIVSGQTRLQPRNMLGFGRRVVQAQRSRSFWFGRGSGKASKSPVLTKAQANGQSDNEQPSSDASTSSNSDRNDTSSDASSTSSSSNNTKDIGSPDDSAAGAMALFSGLMNGRLRESLSSTGSFVAGLYSQVQNPILERIRAVPVQTQKMWQRTPQLVEGSDEIGLGFSAGGLLFPYYIGVVDELRRQKIITERTKIAGSSAGSLIAACSASGLSMSDIELLCRDLMSDCRENGTPRRLGIVLRGLLNEALPDNIHERCRDTAFVGVTLLTPVGKAGPMLVSEYRSRDDLIDALLTSCHIPVYLDGNYVTRFREHWAFDGGLTDFIPEPNGVGRVYRATCFPLSSQLKRPGIYENLAFAPDMYASPSEVIPSLREFVQMAFLPAEDGQVSGLLEMGRRDAAAFIEQELRAAPGERRSDKLLAEQRERAKTDALGSLSEEITKRFENEGKVVSAEESRTSVPKGY